MTERFVQALPGAPVREVVSWELFDTHAFANNGTTTVLVFFLNPNQASPLTSNMHSSGQLSTPQQMDVYGLAVEIFPDWDDDFDHGIRQNWAAEKKKIRETAWLQFQVGEKSYLTLPLLSIPEGMGGAGPTAGADDTTGAVNEIVLTFGTQDVKHYYPVSVPIQGVADPVEIVTQQGFKVTITWDTGTVPNLSETGRSGITAQVRVYLVGQLWRGVQ